MPDKSLVVYTVLTGTNEQLHDAFSGISTSIDRICFTDDLSLESDAWTIRRFDTHALDSPRASRRPKLLPHRYLQQYEWSLYVDNTVTFKQDPSVFLKKYISSNRNFFCFPHQDRDCIYDEAETVIQLGKEAEARVREQMDHYKKLGFPKNYGLITATMLLRRHNNPQLIELSEEWFEHVLRYSKRDQLSFDFIRRRKNFDVFYFEGKITDNDYVEWPNIAEQSRLPNNFDACVYDWLNPDVQKSGLSPEEHYLKIGYKTKSSYCRHDWQLRKIANKYKSDKGSIYYNTHAYADIYEYFLRRYRNQPIKILEMGLLRHDVQARNPGGPYDAAPSLQMWREYFPKAEIIGFDIADFSAVPEMPGVTIFRGDMGNESDLMDLVNKTGGKFDVIIDDASHASHHQQIALGFLFRYLRSGGYFFLEDLHFQPAALERKDAVKTAELLKRINAKQMVETKFISRPSLSYLQSHLQFIKFYDSWDRNFGVIFDDAFAVLRKTGGDSLLGSRRFAKVVRTLRRGGKRNR